MPRAPGKGHRSHLPFLPPIPTVISTGHGSLRKESNRDYTETHSVKFIHSNFNNVVVFGSILKTIRGILTALGKEGVLHSFIHST